MMRVVCCLLLLGVVAEAFVSVHRLQSTPPLSQTSTSLGVGIFSFGGGNTIPKTVAARDQQAIRAVQAAIAKPRFRDYSLIECEFPPLGSLNKLGDGSLRSSNQVDDANVAFCKKLLQSIGGLLGPKVWLLVSSTASSNFVQKVTRQIPAGKVHSFRNGAVPPGLQPSDLCVVVTPSVQSDYQCSRQLVDQCRSVVVVNAQAKDPKSIPGQATMAYFLKPLTYNSQVAGYLLRSYPGDWAVVDAAANKVLETFSDAEILVPKTNTPDLRGPGRLVQKAVDERAIRARQQQR